MWPENLRGHCFHRSTSSFFFARWLLFYRKESCYGSEILNVCMSNQKKMIYGKKSVTRPPLHIALCYNSRWNGPISNFFSFWATERLFISKWGRISPESDWCWLKLVFGASSLLLRGYMDLSPAVGHVRECPHSGTRYFLYICVIVMRDIGIYRVIALYKVLSSSIKLCKIL